MPCALRGEAVSGHDAECLSSDPSTVVVYQPTWLVPEVQWTFMRGGG